MTTKKTPKNLGTFRALHDDNVVIPNKIKAALATMAQAGHEEWEYEGDFIKLAKLSTTQLGAHREQFLGYIVETSGKNAKRVWFATEKAAKSARGE